MILYDIVQAQLVKAVIGVAAVIVVEFDFEAVAVIPIGAHHAQGGIALGAERNVAIGFVVDDDPAGLVFLIFAGFEEALPIVHDDINGVHAGGVKQPRLIAPRVIRALKPEPFRVAEQHRYQQDEDERRTADPVD